MHCARAVIGTAVAGIPEWIEDGLGGFLAEAPTIRHLDQCMERVSAARDRLRAMGAQAKLVVEKSLGDPIDFLAKKLVNIARWQK